MRSRATPLIMSTSLGILIGLALVTPLHEAASRGTTDMLQEFGEGVVVSDPLEPTEHTFVLNGKLTVRSGAAAYLYLNGYTREILLAPTADRRYVGALHASLTSSETLTKLIELRGVPASAIRVIPVDEPVSTTRDEIRALRRYLMDHPIKKLIVVTTDYHTGRVHRILEQELAGLDVSIRMAAAQDDNGIDPTNWWTTLHGIRTYAGEYLKTLGARLGL